MPLPIDYDLKIIHAPSAQPITLAEAKLHMRVDHDDEDTLIERYIKAATKYCENVLRRQLMPATWELQLDRFPSIRDEHPMRRNGESRRAGPVIHLPLPPLIAVQSITYLDGSGVEQTLAVSDYRVTAQNTSGYGAVEPAFGTSWPTTRNVTAAVRIRYTAGYGEAEDIPEEIVSALRFMIAHQYENREPILIGSISKEIELTVNSLLDQERAYAFA